VNIRSLCATDLEAVARIEQQAMAAPWTLAQLQAELQAAKGLSWVAEQGPHLCAYLFFRTCAPECELLHLVVDPERRRQGIGERLLAHGLHVLASRGCTTCFLEVRRSNAAARRLYTKSGFSQVGERKKYYSQPVENALLMQRDLIATT
jgi:ribosomal-protein-alanine N-acetyltransferase